MIRSFRLILYLLFLILNAYLLLISPVPVFAQNKCGINIGPNYTQVSQVSSLIKTGGWVYSFGTLGNMNSLSSLFGKNLNVALRAYNGGQKFDADQALAWTATLGKMPANGQKIFFMPWNEPNQAGECNNSTCTSTEVTAYTDALRTYLSEAKILNTKVSLLSPMIDKLNPTFSQFAGIYNQDFSGRSINEYDQFSPGPCSSASNTQNNCQYDQIGIPAPYYALETGVAGTSCGDSLPNPCYKDEELTNMLSAVWSKWKNDPNFKMFSIFSYDPLRAGNWNLFSAPKLISFYNNNCTSGSIISGSFDETKFNQWFETVKDKLVACTGGGFAPKNRPELCDALGPSTFENGKLFTPNRLVKTADTTDSISDKIFLIQNSPVAFVDGVVVTRGGWFRQFQDLSIPFAKDLTKFLAGPFVRDAGLDSNLQIKRFNSFPSPENAGVLAKLLPEDVQDEMRHLYRWHCGLANGDPNGYYCSSVTIGIAPDCPGPDSNECLFSDGTEFQSDPQTRKPHWKDFSGADGKLDENEMKLYTTALEKWNLPSNKKNRDKWHEIPLISNPKTEVEKAVFINSCPPGISQAETLVKTKTPWISALKDVSTILHDLLVPQGAGSTTLLPNQNTKSSKGDLLASAQLVSANNTSSPNTVVIARSETTKQSPQKSTPQLLAQATDQCFTMNPSSTVQDNGNSTYTIGITLHLYSPPDGGDGHINCLDGCDLHSTRWNKGVNNPYDIYPEHTGGSFVVSAGQPASRNYSLTIDACKTGIGTASLSCNYSVGADGKLNSNCGAYIVPTPIPTICVPPPIPNYESATSSDPVDILGDQALLREPHVVLKASESASFNDPVWAVVKYPFLNTVYENLSGENGIFQIFKPSEETVQDWDWAGESGLSYCFAKHDAPSMIGGELNYVNPATKETTKAFSQPPATCATDTRTNGLSTYPEYIGGVNNAKDWVVNCILYPNSTCASSKGNNSNKAVEQCKQMCTPYKSNPSSNPAYNTSSCPILKYTIANFRDPKIKLADNKKAGFISAVKQKFPNSPIDLNKLNLIEQKAISSQNNSWSPLFITALWVEESGASGIPASDPLGCDPYGNPNNSLETSLNCLLNSFQNETDFNRFMFRYSSYDDRDLCQCFCLNPNFPGNFQTAYQFVQNYQ